MLVRCFSARLELVYVFCVLGLMLCGCRGDGLVNFSYSNFTNTDALNLLGNAKLADNNKDLVIVPSDFSVPVGGVWYKEQIQVRGFRSNFTYTISNNSGGPERRDGVAFVIQLSSNEALGPVGMGLGYGGYPGSAAGITSSIAVEFDSFYNPEVNDPTPDPNPFHISVHTCGLDANSADEKKSIWQRHLPNSELILGTQTVEIIYEPINSTQGQMSITFKGVGLGAFTMTNLDTYLGLDATSGSAWVGFTASHSNPNDTYPGESITLNSWNFQFLGVIQPAKCIVFGIDDTSAGTQMTFYLQTVDNYGYNMSTDSIATSLQTPQITITQPGPPVNGTILYSGEGLYKIGVTGTVSGNATVNLTLGGVPIGAGQYSFGIYPGAPYPNTSYPYGSGLDTQVAAGTVNSFWIQLRDVYGNNVTANVSTPLSVVITPTLPSEGEYPNVSITYDAGSGRHLATYNVTMAGNYTLRVLVDNINSSQSGHALQIFPAALHPGTSILYGIPPNVTAGTLQEAYIQLRDVFANNITAPITPDPIVTFVIVLGSVSVNGTVTPLGSGRYRITYNATQSGVYSVIPLVNGEGVIGYSLPVPVIPNVVDPLHSYAYGKSLTSGVAGDNSFFFVQLTDVFGNNITSSEPDRVVAYFSGNAPQPITTMPLNGTYLISYNLTVSGSYSLTVNASGGTVGNGVQTVVIMPAAVSPIDSVGYGNGLTGSGLVVGLNEFYVQFRDHYLNNVTTYDHHDLLVQIADVHSSLVVNASTMFDSSTGVYDVQYNVTLASTYVVSITIDGQPILNYQTDLTLVPGAIFPAQSVISGDRDSNATAGVTRTFTVQLRDEFGNNIPSVPDVVTATFSSPLSVWFHVQITPNQNGLYTCTYNATVTGAYTLVVSVTSSRVANFSVLVLPNAPYPLNCVAEGTGLNSSVAGDTSYIIIYLFDTFNNPINTPADPPPVVSIATPTGEEVEVHIIFDYAVVAYEAVYNITVSETYTVGISIGGAQIKTPPATLVVVPDLLHAPNCLAVGFSLENGTAGLEGAFTVQLRDVYGNNITDYDQVTTFSFGMMIAGTPANPPPSPPTPTNDGLYILKYYVTISGHYVSTITINNANILGSPFLTQISPAQFDQSGSTVVGLNNEVLAGHLNNFSIQLRDIFGNIIQAEDINIDEIALVFDNMAVADSAVTYKQDGVYSVSYNYTVAGSYSPNVTIENIPVLNGVPESVLVQPDAVYPPACYATGDATTKAYVKRDNTFSLFIRDRYNNSRMWSEEEPQVTLTTTGEAAVMGILVNQTDGSYLVTYYIGSQASYQMTIKINNQQISGSPFTVSTQYPNNSLSTLAIVGIVIGVLAGVGLAGFGAYRLYRHSRRDYIPI